jgi:hypothetical protein
VAEVRQAASSGKKYTPHHEDDDAADNRRTLLTIEALQGEAREAEGHVRKVVAEVAEQYRAELAQRSEQVRQAVQAGVEAIRARLVELRAVAVCEVWVDQVLAGTRVKALGVDVSGIDEALAPVGMLLAGPSGEGDIGHYLNNLRQGDSGQAFTIPIGSVSNRRR